MNFKLISGLVPTADHLCVHVNSQDYVGSMAHTHYNDTLDLLKLCNAFFGNVWSISQVLRKKHNLDIHKRSYSLVLKCCKCCVTIKLSFTLHFVYRKVFEIEALVELRVFFGFDLSVIDAICIASRYHYHALWYSIQLNTVPFTLHMPCPLQFIGQDIEMNLIISSSCSAT